MTCRGAVERIAEAGVRGHKWLLGHGLERVGVGRGRVSEGRGQRVWLLLVRRLGIELLLLLLLHGIVGIVGRGHSDTIQLLLLLHGVTSVWQAVSLRKVGEGRLWLRAHHAHLHGSIVCHIGLAQKGREAKMIEWGRNDA